MFSSSELGEIRNSVDIVDVVSSYINLTAHGKNYFGVCPFHDDHSPSMCVSKEKQIYTCFVCGATGNVFQFIKEYENISFAEAVRKVATIGGIDVKIDEMKPIKKESVLYDIYDLSNKIYQLNLNTSKAVTAREYLKKRGIDDNTIKEFGIGLALIKGNIAEALIKKGFDESDIIKSGLADKNNYGLNDLYRNRIMFPLWDLKGKVVGFSGRIFNDENAPKYINSRETEIFKKGELLYNYHRARNECRRKNEVIIMEGFMDVICAYTHGITNVVAAMGTAITSANAHLISRMAKNIILCFDGDDAGILAANACTNELLKLDVFPSIVVLDKTKGKDPDEYIRNNGIEAFKEKIMHPLSVMEFKEFFNKKGIDMGDSSSKALYVKKMINEIDNITDSVLKEITISKLANETGLSADFIKSQLKNNIVKETTIIPEKKEQNLLKYEKAEMNLIYYMLKDSKVILQYDARKIYLPTEKYRFLVREICAYYQKYGNINIADFLTFIGKNTEMVKVMGSITALDLRDEYSKDEIEDYMNAINDYNKEEEIKNLKQKMKNSIDYNEKLELAKKIAILNGRGE
ncbi:dNA primase [Firmicutes bacterium CAG:884]|nr:dNA primase [Firmicutes bacterium CAG:884]